MQSYTQTYNTNTAICGVNEPELLAEYRRRLSAQWRLPSSAIAQIAVDTSTKYVVITCYISLEGWRNAPGARVKGLIAPVYPDMMMVITNEEDLRFEESLTELLGF